MGIEVIRFGFVTLSDFDVQQALQNADERHSEAIRQGRRDQHGLSARGKDEKYEHQLGSLGEKATAVRSGVEWPATVNTYKSIPDLAGCEIRTRSKTWQELYVRKREPAAPYILVHLLEWPWAFNVTGWKHSKDVKKPRFLKAHGGRPPAYFLPLNMLNDYTPYEGEIDDLRTRREVELLIAESRERVKGYEPLRQPRIVQYPEGHPYAGFWYQAGGTA